MWCKPNLIKNGQIHQTSIYNFYLLFKIIMFPKFLYLNRRNKTRKDFNIATDNLVSYNTNQMENFKVKKLIGIL